MKNIARQEAILFAFVSVFALLLLVFFKMGIADGAVARMPLQGRVAGMIVLAALHLGAASAFLVAKDSRREYRLAAAA